MHCMCICTQTHTHTHTHAHTCTHIHTHTCTPLSPPNQPCPTLTTRIIFRQHTALANSSSSAPNTFFACWQYSVTTSSTSWSVAMRKHQNGIRTSHTCTCHHQCIKDIHKNICMYVDVSYTKNSFCLLSVPGLPTEGHNHLFC